MLFLFPIALPPGRFEGVDCFVFHEDCGMACMARWCDLDGLDVAGGLDLFPKGLKPWLRAAWGGGPG